MITVLLGLTIVLTLIVLDVLHCARSASDWTPEHTQPAGQHTGGLSQNVTANVVETNSWTALDEHQLNRLLKAAFERRDERL